MKRPSHDTSHDRPAGDGLACHACEVICERVVYPTRCLRSSCCYVYSYEEWGATFFGCMQKVFRAELDLGPHYAHPRRDVYGALVARRQPLPQCQVEIERAYDFRYSRRECRNPIFRQSPGEYAPDAVRRLVHGDGHCPSRETGPGDT